MQRVMRFGKGSEEDYVDFKVTPGLKYTQPSFLFL